MEGVIIDVLYGSTYLIITPGAITTTCRYTSQTTGKREREREKIKEGRKENVFVKLKRVVVILDI